MRRTLPPILFIVLVAIFSSPGPLQAAGRFRVEYRPASEPAYAEWRKELKEGRVLEEIAQELNGVFLLPRDLAIGFDQCGEPNAFYDREARSVILCYELLGIFTRRFQEELGEDADKVGDAVMGAVAFVFFHELGHALVDVLELPVTGREEDAVDQLATLILADGSDAGERSALHGALSFYLDGEKGGEVDDSAFWDEHSLNAQRFYNIVCWVYGHAPERHADLVEDGTLPEERAQRCPDEWSQLERSWTTLLEPHINPSAAAEQAPVEAEPEPEAEPQAAPESKPRRKKMPEDMAEPDAEPAPVRPAPGSKVFGEG